MQRMIATIMMKQLMVKKERETWSIISINAWIHSNKRTPKLTLLSTRWWPIMRWHSMALDGTPTCMECVWGHMNRNVWSVIPIPDICPCALDLTYFNGSHCKLCGCVTTLNWLESNKTSLAPYLCGPVHMPPTCQNVTDHYIFHCRKVLKAKDHYKKSNLHQRYCLTPV